MSASTQDYGTLVSSCQASENLHAKEVRRVEALATKISFGRLITFLSAVVVAAAGCNSDSTPMISVGATLAAAFFILVAVHARVIDRKRISQARRDIYSRHLSRLTEGWQRHPDDGSEHIPAGHPYARDIDLVGPGSLFQRIDVTHTKQGARTLARWLGGLSENAEQSRKRQKAVAELRDKPDLREELEAAAALVQGDEKLDPEGFLAFVRKEPYLQSRIWLKVLIYISPIALCTLYALAQLGRVPWDAAWAALAAQMLISMGTTRPTAEAFDLVSARKGYLEAFQRLLITFEEANVESPLLEELQKRLIANDSPPSVYLRRLSRWASYAELRTQFPLNLIANWLLLWDLHVLLRLETWIADVGPELQDSFDALGELEALASLATLAALEPVSCVPEIEDSEASFQADTIGHPLLPFPTRVANDLRLRGPKSAIVVTGSNMAGKSTLLRAIGLNIAVALAGGLVPATNARVPWVRLRASMRAEDSLQEGSSYFHAELGKLRGVTSGAESSPRVLFLLDELLRGTNARARHLGARAVLLHMLNRGASGLVATHDAALGELEGDPNIDVNNVHFTDVMQGGEMTFDYELRDGIVKTSNALYLLRKAGVDVEDVDMPPLVTSAEES